MKYEEEKKYIGNREQLFRVKKVKLQDGKAKDVTMLDVENRSGMQFSVNPDRGMDIPYLNFKGENIGYISPCGIVSPEYFDDKELGFLKSFTAGFLTTCGLNMAGAPCEYKEKAYGLHGNISHTPAENYSYEIIEDVELPYTEIKGTVKDAVIFGPKLTLNRHIRCYYKEKRIILKDKVTNEGYKKVCHMILYHCNIGYPILSPQSEIYIPTISMRSRNAHAEEGKASWMKMQEAEPDYEEMCYYHTLASDCEKKSTVAIYNPTLEIGIAIEIMTDTLDHFIQWKMMGAGEYVMGLEAGNTTIDGIENAIQNGSMKYLCAGESIEYQ
ncbi:MAG: aldose 1-epimerase family protein, partial [Lachnospiraceae bacterium]